jgi:Fe-S-cluster containining protein
MTVFNIELDLDKIQEYGKKREDQNWKFRAFLKGKDYDKIDKIVHKLTAEISAKIDCTTCGNCCVRLKSSLTVQDIKRLSNTLQLKENEFIDKYTVNEDGDIFLKNLPCDFLKDKKCTIYNDRPEDCRSFPNLHKNNFTNRLISVIENYSICPIVYNVFEQLKRELYFR